MNPDPADPVLPRATAGVKRLRISVSTIAAGAKLIPIKAPLCAPDNLLRPDGAMIDAAEESVNGNIRQS
jgi:hypothetical protein